MPFSESFNSPRVNVLVDMGHPFLNRTLDGFIKIGSVAVTKVALEETFDMLKGGSISQNKAKNALKKMCKEGVYYGSIGGLYVGMEYVVERICGTKDWKNAMIGGALTGALISVASNKSGDHIIKDAITGGAIATASEFINHIQ
ncbi:outer envelope pore protein 16, chloroplastic [Impatiens glandulifera]|uniref:outer envelope pore protein 16, chloroplastic n=1 Tax=Impatiens glandulifera TaxID=253017 RepID=UPI001FB0AD85|nr:outer envelope pore protein 16, chloroplastic [Impatiens glandulifera]